MVTVYPKEFLDENEVVDLSFHYPKNPNAKHDRDVMAKALRKQGYEVKTRKWTFHGDLCSGESYTLFATRKKQTSELDWLWYGTFCSLAHEVSAQQVVEGTA
jgi:hypothetical protein